VIQVLTDPLIFDDFTLGLVIQYGIQDFNVLGQIGEVLVLSELPAKSFTAMEAQSEYTRQFKS